jgi:hypothetical protein
LCAIQQDIKNTAQYTKQLLFQYHGYTGLGQSVPPPTPDAILGTPAVTGQHILVNFRNFPTIVHLLIQLAFLMMTNIHHFWVASNSR